MPLNPIDGGVGGAPAVDGGPVGTGGTPSAIDGGAKVGSACVANTECPSGYCVGGLCCDSACSGSCYSCVQLYTGKPDGTCAPVGAGKKDPSAVCKDETASNQCGSDGTCDGAGACRKVGTDHVCTTASCNGAVFTPTSTCDGKGACQAVPPQDCGSAACDVVDGCRTACTGDKDCPATSYCNATTKRCAAKKIAGDSCAGSTECVSGFCADGVCCNTACADKCMACSASLTTGKSGVCSPIKVGTDPHNSCEIDTTNECGADGTCDGAGACRMTGADHVCKPAACSNGIFTHAATCDGKGVCGTPTADNCGAFTCSASNGCQKSCAADSDCSAQSYCDSATKSCSTKKDNGSVCKVANECASGNCVDGMCCNSKCDGACTACQKTYTNGTDGSCAPVSKGQDPYSSCQEETSTSKCGNTGMCDGAGACQKADSTTTCGDASCGTSGSSATYTPASKCDGSGTCKPGSVTNCGQFQCSALTGCLTICSGNSDCSSATYCDPAKSVCSPKLGPGSTCGGDSSKCASGHCVDGVCCDSTCGSSCYSCNVTGSVGKCVPAPLKSVDPKGICAVTKSTCGQNGSCDGSGNCYVPPAGTTGPGCTTTCSGSTLTTSSCDGKGSCGASSKACDNNLICGSAAECKTSCSTTSDCTSGLICPTYGPRSCAPAGVAAQYAWTNGVHRVFTGDFNGDGIWDIGVTSAEGETSFAGIWYIRYGDGAGGFSAKDDIQFNWGNGTHNAFTGDFNGDGYWDIGVTNTATESVAVGMWYIRYNNKAGGFSATDSIQYSWKTGNHNVFAGDFNGDGYTDIGMTDTATDNIVPKSTWYIRYNNKAGGFSATDDISFTWGNANHNIFTGDFNGDGYWDIGVTNTSQEFFTPLDGWYIRYNNKAGSFATSDSLQLGWRVGSLYNVFTGKFFKNDTLWHVGLTNDGSSGSLPKGGWYIH